ncbi:MAG TPA: D-glycero-beta-D-manno-heptose 1-phosphate adenylyltransferase [Gemmataceae bacterium]|jgi:D-beta-D-heptose 7-phosphate kinase/D-beta-D-heptose 1-phosphate adenosyltransferase
MRHSLDKHVDAFPRLRVLVVGEAMLDSYLKGGSSRLCPEAPVPVVTVASRRDAAGGAANTAVNLHALGATVRLLSLVGNDAEGLRLRRCLEQHGLAADHLLVQEGRRTLSKQRVCAGSQILVRFDQGDTSSLDPDCEKRMIEQLTALFAACDAVVVSDYGYGVLTAAAIAALAQLQARSPRVVVADSKRLRVYRRVGLTAIKPNYREAARLLHLMEENEPGDRAEQIIRHKKRLLDVSGARLAAVTLDRDGALLLERDRAPYRTFAPASRGCPSGAGDTYLAALTLALASGADTPAAAEIASAAAAVVVAKEATAVCSAAELRDSLTADGASRTSRGRLAVELAEHRRHGRRIVFTNGCFDILHRGHVSYLRCARELGEVLVVGVNSDAGIHRLKGPTRPINTLEDRLTVLAALRCVDYLVPFDEDTPHELIRLVRPDVFVKGGDYTRDRLPEASLVEEQGGIVRILPLVEDHSTTNTIDRIRGSARGEPSAAFSLLNGQATS